MSRGLNKVQIIGWLGRDPEMRFTEDGTALTTFRLAVGSTWTDRNDTEHDDTEWFRVVAWERQAETANEHLTKGDQVYIEGRLRTRRYTDKDGVERTAVEVVATQVIFLGSAQRVREPEADAAPAPPASAAPTVQQRRAQSAARRRRATPSATTPPAGDGPGRGIEVEDLPF